MNYRLAFALATGFEFILALVLLVLFTIGYPDRFRTQLWWEGGSQGWNSDPALRVYDFANYREPPPIALVWDESSTRCYLCISIVTVIVWFGRLCVKRRVFDAYAELSVNILYDVLLVALWTYSAATQSSEDITDLEHISMTPWYLQRGCGEAKHYSACEVMKASYDLSMLAVLWYAVRFLASCMIGAYLLGKDSQREFEEIHKETTGFV